jgi:D-alanyl-D-alanine dipeptidase
MRSVDLYRWGMVVRYNMSPTIPGNGSCIFLHIWRGAGQGTAGCTAMPEEALLDTIHWLNSKAPNALLVQLPESEYRRFKTEWSLP